MWRLRDRVQQTYLGETSAQELIELLSRLGNTKTGLKIGDDIADLSDKGALGGLWVKVSFIFPARLGWCQTYEQA